MNTVVMSSIQTPKPRWWHVADRIGATASFLCAIHCALLPFVLALLPFLGLEFLASDRFERGFVMFASVLAMFALIRGYRRHQTASPLMLAIPGLLLLMIGVTFVSHYSIIVHSVLVTCGGLLLASSHFVNLRHDRQYCRIRAGSVHATGEHVHGPHCIH